MGLFKKSKPKGKEEKPKGKDEEQAKKSPENSLADIFGLHDSAEKGELGDTNNDAKKEKDEKTKEKGKDDYGNGGGVLEDMDAACTLSWKVRLIGFLVCALTGVILVGLGYLFIVLRKIPPFAVVYSIGSLVAILSTGFLVGPMRQFKVMMEKGRIVATVIYVAAIVATIVTGVKKLFIPAIICMILQVLAFIFYSLTFMPFVGRWIKRKCSIPGI